MRRRSRQSMPRRSRRAKPGARMRSALQLALPGAFGLIDERGGMLLGRIAADEAEVLTLGGRTGRSPTGRSPHVLLREARRWLAHARVPPCSWRLRPAMSPHWRCTGGRASSRSARRRRYYADGSDALVLRVNLL